MMPPSPTPLTPKAVSGAGVSSSSSATGGASQAVGSRYSMKVVALGLPSAL